LLPLLQIKNLTIDFPGTGNEKPALLDFSMELNRGELLAVVGESGSGKSVMSLSVMNLLSPVARIKNGSILFSPDGAQSIDLRALSQEKFRSYRGNQMAMIFQEPMTSLNPVMTCEAQCIEPLMLHKKLTRREAVLETINLFEKVHLPDPPSILKRYPHQLSGGQKQRVMIAMAISCRPSLLICDEPTTALDVRVQRTILDLLKELRKSENIGMIFITHDLGLVADMADRALVMWKGQVVESGPVKTIFSNPQHPYTKGLLMCRPGLHKKGERLPVVADFLKSENERKEKFSGLQTEEYRFAEANIKDAVNASQASAEAHEVLIKVRGVSVGYSSGYDWLGKPRPVKDIISDINFDIYKGETLGIVGESGSGKTTLGRALLGLNKSARGSIEYNGVGLSTLRNSELLAFRRNIQMVFQDPYSSLNPRLMIGSAISEPVKVHTSAGRKERKQQVTELMTRVGLDSTLVNRYPHAFSGGQRQRLVIARALILKPGFVVFDESVSALDVSVQAQVLNLINDLKTNMGFTAVFISHDLSVIRYLCDRVLVLEKGKIVESGNAESIYNNPQNAYTRSLIEAIPGKSMEKMS
jgi:peptide/nickel transport system ATP-binding protein